MAPKGGLRRGREQRAAAASAAAAPGVHLEKLLSDSRTLTQDSSLHLVEKKKPALGHSYAVQACARHSLPASLAPLWDPQPEAQKLLAAGAIAGAPLLHTWARDTEHAPPIPPRPGFRGEKKNRNLP